jgi:hypothetical protein
VEADFKSYGYYVRKLTGYVFRAYSDIIDPKGLRSREFHVDHRLSIHSGYTKFPLPVPLNVLCHPANLKVIAGKDNISKNYRSSITLRKLKSQIREFDQKFGKVTFPKYLQLEFHKPKNVVPLEGLSVVGFDPGTTNFGVFGGVLQGVKTLHRVRPLISYMLQNPIKKIPSDGSDFSEAFMREIAEIFRKVKPDVVVIERFQARGLMGPTIELISVMIGLIASLLTDLAEKEGRHIIFRVLTASTWKNSVNRVVSLDNLYERVSAKDKHRMDACLMALSAFPSEDNVYRCLTPHRQAKLVKFITNKGQADKMPPKVSRRRK